MIPESFQVIGTGMHGGMYGIVGEEQKEGLIPAIFHEYQRLVGELIRQVSAENRMILVMQDLTLLPGRIIPFFVK